MKIVDNPNTLSIANYPGDPNLETWALLLSADPDKAKVSQHLETGSLYLAQQANKLLGVLILTPLPDKGMEIKNIAVAPDHQRQGIGRALIRFAIARAKQLGVTYLHIGTGNSSLGQLVLYQRCGFRLDQIEKDFFADYPEPIVENGIRCLDMVRLKLVIDELDETVD